MSGGLVSAGAPVDLISIGVLNCYKSWVHMNPEAFCGDRPGDVLAFAVNQLRVGKVRLKLKRSSKILFFMVYCICYSL